MLLEEKDGASKFIDYVQRKSKLNVIWIPFSIESKTISLKQQKLDEILQKTKNGERVFICDILLEKVALLGYLLLQQQDPNAMQTVFSAIRINLAKLKILVDSVKIEI